MSKYNDFMNNIGNENRTHFQEWIGDNIIFNGVIDKASGKGVGRIFRFEEEIELDANDSMDGINLIAKKHITGKTNCNMNKIDILARIKEIHKILSHGLEGEFDGFEGTDEQPDCRLTEAANDLEELINDLSE
jgi:hypothetical protein